MAEVSKIFFHFPGHLNESLEIDLSNPAPVVGQEGKEDEIHLALEEKTFDDLYNTYKNYLKTLAERDKEQENNDITEEITE